jgi:cell division protein FtsL
MCPENVQSPMVVTTAVTGILFVLLVVSLSLSYLIYVRIKHLQREVERLRSKMEVEDEELEKIESSLKSLDM